VQYFGIRDLVSEQNGEWMAKKKTASAAQQNSEKICKAVHQYSSGKIKREDMDRLLDIARDCMTVSNYVFQRYGGIKGLYKIYPGYTVQNEMTASGLREKLNLPTVYFYPAVFNALREIKTQWAHVKREIYAAINQNERLAPEDRHYLRFAIKVDGCFQNILNGKPVNIPDAMMPKYESILSELQGGSERRKNLNRYLCRQVRKRVHKLHTEKFLYFSVWERGYRYGTLENKKDSIYHGEACHGIFLTTKEHRKRIFIPLTDSNKYHGVIGIKLKPEKNSIEIITPLFVKIREHKDYTNEIGISLGLWDMLTTDTGNVYGRKFGKLQKELYEYIIVEWRIHGKENNFGRKQYLAHKEKLEASLKNYINMEINRMLAEEKPGKIYMAKLPRSSGVGNGANGNSYLMRTWRKGYVTERLKWKCAQNGIGIIEVLGKDLGRECSVCGALCEAQAKNRYGNFKCPDCGYEADRKVNAAKNALYRGKTGKQLNKVFPKEEGLE